MKKYCRLCKKKETRSECSFGPKMWDKYTVDDASDKEIKSAIKTADGVGDVGSMGEEINLSYYTEEGLRDWFGKSKSKDGKKGWVNVVTGGTCASDKPGEGTPKCVSSAKRASMSKKERLSAQRRKKAADPGQQQKTGAAKPTYVPTDKPKKNMKEETVTEAKDKPSKGSGSKDACYHKVKSRYSVWPSAYASGALVKCRKVGAANWGNSTKKEGMEEFYNLPELTETQIAALKYVGYEVEVIDEACWKGYEKKGMKTMFGKRYPNCVKKEEKDPFGRPGGKYGGVPKKGSGYDKAYQANMKKIKELEQKEEVELTEEVIIDIAFDGLIEEGYEENDVREAIHWALYEAKVTFGHDTKKPEGLMAKAKKRLGMLGKKARHAVAKGQVATYNKKREISQNIGDKARRAKQSVSNTVKKAKEAPGKAKSGVKGFVKRQAQKVVDRMSEDYDTTEWRDGYTPTEIETTDLIKPEPIKGGQLHEVERTKMQTGNLYQVIFGWRGKMMMVKLFFPDAAVPTRPKVARALDKMYPGAQLRSYSHSVVDYDDPYINVGTNEETIHENKEEEKYCRLCEKKEPRSKCAYGPKMWDKYTVNDASDDEKSEAASESGITEDVNKEVEDRMQADENRKRTQMRNKHRASRLRQIRDLRAEHSDWRSELEEGKGMEGMTQKGGHKRSTESGAGLTQKGVEKYRRQNPGSKLQTAVTTPPSKLKPGSKAAKRRKSFCARSRGWTGERGKAARRRWNC